jgi:hypothetical protein
MLIEVLYIPLMGLSPLSGCELESIFSIVSNRIYLKAFLGKTYAHQKVSLSLSLFGSRASKIQSNQIVTL